MSQSETGRTQTTFHRPPTAHHRLFGLIRCLQKSLLLLKITKNHCSQMKGYDQSEASFPKSRTNDKTDLCYSLSKGISARHAAAEERRVMMSPACLGS